MKASQRFRQRAKDVQAFRDAFAELVKIMEQKPAPMGMGLLTVMKPKKGKEGQARLLDADVSRLSGRASIASRGYEQPLGVDIPGRGQMTVLPIQGWRSVLDYPFLVEPEYALSLINQAVGSLEAEAEAAEAREKSFVGRVAAFVGFPAAVRAAVVAEHPNLGKAAFTAGVIAQIFIAGVGGLVAAAMTAGVAALWKGAVHSSPAPTKSRQPVTSVISTPAQPPTGSATPAPTRT